MSTAGFDPNAAASADSGIFGLPEDPAAARLVYLPVPWEVTTSYRGGTAAGPAAILEASRQVDLFDHEVERPYEAGLYLQPADPRIAEWNAAARPLAEEVIAVGGQIGEDARLASLLARVNERSVELNRVVREMTEAVLGQGRIPVIVGGDHSTPFGAIEAAADRQPGLGVLQIDAHMDLRHAYEGFVWSHASVMRNVLERLPGVARLVQVGIRDYCQEEAEFAAAEGERVEVFYDADLARRQFAGEPWGAIVPGIVGALPRDVWISFDIDGLDPRFCPHTGTPVPGGLDFNQAVFLVAELVRRGRRIVGFDLNEVAPGPEGEWDANVGARLLYKLSAWTLVSHQLCRERPR